MSFDRPYPAPGAGEMRFGAVPVVVAAERLGLPLAYLTSVDLARRPDALAGARAYVSTGHDEYWTPEARRRVAAARDAGTNLLFLGANTAYWRIRVADVGGRPGRLVTGYRGDAAEDPAPCGRPPACGATLRSPSRRTRSPGCSTSASRSTSRSSWPHRTGGASPAPASPAARPSPTSSASRRTGSTRSPGRLARCRSWPRSAIPAGASRPRPRRPAHHTAPSGAGVLAVGTLQWTCALEDHCALGRQVEPGHVVVGRVTSSGRSPGELAQDGGGDPADEARRPTRPAEGAVVLEGAGPLQGAHGEHPGAGGRRVVGRLRRGLDAPAGVVHGGQDLQRARRAGDGVDTVRLDADEVREGRAAGDAGAGEAPPVR